MFDRIKSLLNRQPNSEAATETVAGAAQTPAPQKLGWIGVDLDGTLAEYTEWQGLHHIGEPIPAMLERVKQWIASGYTVKIFTARASVLNGDKPVAAWLKKHGLPALEVTNQKDFGMIELWDDRAVQVIHNTGQPAVPSVFTGSHEGELPPQQP